MSVKQKIDAGFSSLFKFNGKLKNAYYDEELVQKKIMVQADTLDNWCMKNNVNNVDIIWIDVQGAELLVFCPQRVSLFADLLASGYYS
jgi:FkbM family methyltransferase